MKTNFLILCICALLTMSCENPMTFRTKVNEDGSLDKTITFEKAEEKVATENIFDIGEKKGWSVKKQLITESTKKRNEKKEFKIEFSKHFATDEEMNKELDPASDTLFHIRSKFEKNFRWFYTYIKYSETIRPINRFKMISPKDFFNREDSLFIQRLPSEGKAISSADSVFLQVLNEKITGRFANLAIFKETYKVLEDVARKNSLDQKWLDTLSKKRDFIYQLVEKDQGEFQVIAVKVFDTLSIPLPRQKVLDDCKTLSKDLKSRTDFMAFARDGKYLNEFEMPLEIVTSNADSVAGKNLYWRPLVNKFVYMDYEMYAECRKMNWWAIAISIAIVGFTVFSLWKGGSRH
jgi:hypothetical protein